jgi:hypothetical protein
MAFEYTNRKGVTYYLRRSTTKRGKTRYVFSRKPGGDEVEAVPEGYEVRESVNGQVSLAAVQPRRITEAEEGELRALLERLKPGYRLQVKGDELVIFEPSMTASSLMGVFKGMPGSTSPAFARKLSEVVSANARYEPLLKFELLDKDTRRFSAHRMVFRGQGGWSYPLESGDLITIARALIPHLGQDSFYELM